MASIPAISVAIHALSSSVNYLLATTLLSTASLAASLPLQLQLLIKKVYAEDRTMLGSSCILRACFADPPESKEFTILKTTFRKLIRQANHILQRDQVAGWILVRLLRGCGHEAGSTMEPRAGDQDLCRNHPPQNDSMTVLASTT